MTVIKDATDDEKLQVINLKEQLNSDDNKKYYRYLLLDMLGVTSELSNIYSQALKDSSPTSDIAIIKRPELLHDLSSCPHLICIGKPNQDINEELLSSSIWQVEDDFLTTKQYVCGWIVSEKSTDELAKSLCDIGIKLGTLLSMRFIAFYEPFRLQLLQQSHPTAPNWLGSLFPTKTKYYYCDLQQTLQEISAEDNWHFSQLFFDHKISFFQKESVKLFKLYTLWHDIKQQQKHTVNANEFTLMMSYYVSACLLGLTHAEDRAIFVFFAMQYGDLLQSQHIKMIVEEVALNFPGELSMRFREIDTQFPKLLKIA
ncbi:hypothetical protein RHO13_08105 [Orbus wheelerorum]|uniref:hypothetical protein n=1 Tax=Orbus wheelerorum TaxID=3074111 RepID=UPI00370D8D8A